PDWFTAGLPGAPLDGELWIGRKQFQRTLAVVRRQDGGDLWREVRFLVFDAPAVPGGFEHRMAFVKRCMNDRRPPHARRHEHSLIAEKGATIMAVSSSAPRRFQFTEGNSHKFWEISAAGVEVTVRFGRIGTEGQVQVKSFADAEAAATHVERMVREKTGKGY